MLFAFASAITEPPEHHCGAAARQRVTWFAAGWPEAEAHLTLSERAFGLEHSKMAGEGGGEDFTRACFWDSRGDLRWVFGSPRGQCAGRPVPWSPAQRPEPSLAGAGQPPAGRRFERCAGRGLQPRAEARFRRVGWRLATRVYLRDPPEAAHALLPKRPAPASDLRQRPKSGAGDVWLSAAEAVAEGTSDSSAAATLDVPSVSEAVSVAV